MRVFKSTNGFAKTTPKTLQKEPGNGNGGLEIVSSDHDLKVMAKSSCEPPMQIIKFGMFEDTLIKVPMKNHAVL